jgi:hypothetical protein
MAQHLVLHDGNRPEKLHQKKTGKSIKTSKNKSFIEIRKRLHLPYNERRVKPFRLVIYNSFDILGINQDFEAIVKY